MRLRHLADARARPVGWRGRIRLDMSTRVQPSPVPLVPPATVTSVRRRAADLRRRRAGARARRTTPRRRSARPCATRPRWPPCGRRPGSGSPRSICAGLRWWPGVLLGELVVNTEQHLADPAIPLGSLLGQQTGNMAEIVIGAVLLTRLIGRARGARPRRPGGRDARRARGRRRDQRHAPAPSRCWRAGSSTHPTCRRSGGRGGSAISPARSSSWPPRWRGARQPAAAWRRLRTPEGALMVAAVVAARRARGLDRGAAHLRGLPGADLVGVPLRARRARRWRSRSPARWRSGSRPPRSGPSSSSRSTTGRSAPSSTSPSPRSRR